MRRSTAVTPLVPRLPKDAWPLNRVRCVLSPWGFVRLEHLTLPGPGACLRSPWGGVRLRGVVRRSCQRRSDPPRTQSSLPPPHRGSSFAFDIYVDRSGPSVQVTTKHEQLLRKTPGGVGGGGEEKEGGRGGRGRCERGRGGGGGGVSACVCVCVFGVAWGVWGGWVGGVGEERGDGRGGW